MPSALFDVDVVVVVVLFVFPSKKNLARSCVLKFIKSEITTNFV